MFVWQQTCNNAQSFVSTSNKNLCLWFQDKEKQEEEINVEYSFQLILNQFVQYTCLKSTVSFWHT
jgi:hypothetical protein